MTLRHGHSARLSPDKSKQKGDTTMSANEIASKVRELREMMRLIEEAQAEAAAIKALFSADDLKPYTKTTTVRRFAIA